MIVGDKTLYTVREITRATNLHRTTIYTDIKNGRLLAEKVGTGYIITRENLIAYLDYRRSNKK